MLTQIAMRYASTVGFVLALFCSSSAGEGFAQGETRNALVFRVAATKSQLTLTEKDARLLELPARIKTVDGFDPAILKITTVDNFHQIRILAVTPGFTAVTLVDEHGQSYTVDVLVNGDVKQFQALVRQAAPGSAVQAIKVKDAVLLLGWVDEAGQATKIVELAEMHFTKVLNYLQVSGVQTIMLRVRMMEAQRSKIRALGFNFLNLTPNGFVASGPGALVPFTTSTVTPSSSGSFGGFLGPITSLGNPAAATAAFGVINNDNAFQGFIEALRQESLLTILAEPNLTTTNGRPANFLDGGQFPVPIPQGLGTVSIQYKSFGVQLEFVPTILSSGRLRMQVCPEVSSKDLSNTVVVQGITVPSLITRRVNTEVEMNFGETLIIAGLISNQVTATASKIPFLGELPFIGAAFRRVNHNEAETELIVMVTPELVSPVDETQLPDGPGRSTTSPTDRELFFNGYLETPRYAPTPEPPPTAFGVGSYTNPGMGMPADAMGPQPLYDGNGMPGTAPMPNPGPLPAPPAQGNPPNKAVPPTPAQDAGEGPSVEESSRAKPRNSIRQMLRPRQSTANTNPVRTLTPPRNSNGSGAVVPASGAAPDARRPADVAGGPDAPSFISPR